MQKVNLKSIDLNLLVILQSLMETRHVSATAEKLNMSQPAVSRALQRIRHTFNDPILVRTNQGYDLSAKAILIDSQLSQLLQGIEQLVLPAEFVPAAATGVLKFYGVDVEILSYMPEFVNRLQQQAPKLQVEIRTEPRPHFELLEQGEVHFVLTGMKPTTNTDQLHSAPLGSTSHICAMREDHPLADKKLTLARYLSAPHGLVSLVGSGPGSMDRILESIGKKRHVALRLANFTQAAYFCEASDIIFTMPEVVAHRLASKHKLVLRKLPKEIVTKEIHFNLYWHERHHKDPMCMWAKELLIGSL